MNYIIIIIICIILHIYIEIYNKKKIIIIFDLDETIGCFSELSIIINIFENLIKRRLYTQECFYIFDTFPEYFRPNIFSLFESLCVLKEQQKIHKIVLYTNNDGDLNWVENIIHYIHDKVNFEVFDEIIASYINDTRRIYNEKHVYDIENILNININKYNCIFIDDKSHKFMKTKNIKYFHINPYIICLGYNVILKKLSQKLNNDIYDELLEIKLKKYIEELNINFNREIVYVKQLEVENILYYIQQICN